MYTLMKSRGDNSPKIYVNFSLFSFSNSNKNWRIVVDIFALPLLDFLPAAAAVLELNGIICNLGLTIN